jgi:hypothetical protein
MASRFVDVNPGKLFSVSIVNGSLPMLVLPAAIFAESRFASFLDRRELWHRDVGLSGLVRSR